MKTTSFQRIRKSYTTRTTSLIIAIVMVFAFFPFTALNAETITGEIPLIEGDFVYRTDGERASLLGYRGPGGSVTFPETLGGYPLTKIEYHALENKTDLTNIKITDRITDIDIHAFTGCTNLMAITVDAKNPSYSDDNGILFNKGKTVLIKYPEGKGGIYYIPTGVTEIENDAFYNCTNLTSVTIPNGVTKIGSRTFEGCTNLTNVILPDSLTYIAPLLFSGCTSLTSIKIPDSVAHISEGAFADCANLTSITMPKSIVVLNDGVFINCTSLTSIFIPENVWHIGEWTFSGCTSLTEIIVDTNNAIYSDSNGILFSKDKAELYRYPAGKIGVYTIPSNVTKIYTRAFTECTKLTSIRIPDNVRNIGVNVFENCKNLTLIVDDLSYAKTYAEENNIKYLLAGPAIDESHDNGNVKLTAPAKVIPAGSEFNVMPLKLPENIDTAIKTQFGDTVQIPKYYDISLYNDGNKIASNGAVTLKIRIDSENPRAFKFIIVSVSDDGTINELPTTIKKGYAVSDTENLGHYALVQIERTWDLRCGDVNYDNEIDDQDAIFFARYLAGWDVAEMFYPEAADIDADEEISDMDAIALARHLAGWKIETKIGAKVEFEI